jgi:HAD superfamily hydrolase (TIGR01509 family)
VAAIDLIIFDCDGVLVDSEPLSIRILVAAIAAQGITIDPEAAYRDYLGRSLSSISESLTNSHGMPLGAAALESMRGDLHALYRRELKASPGVAEALDTIGVPFCVASSSPLERIRLSLELTGLAGRFGNRIFSSAMVANGKPAPDLFLHAAEALDARPDRCLVIEDSPAGIAAARTAGMMVFAYTGGGHIALGRIRPLVEALKPDAIFDDMRLLPDLVSSQQRLQTAS